MSVANNTHKHTYVHIFGRNLVVERRKFFLNASLAMYVQAHQMRVGAYTK